MLMLKKHSTLIRPADVQMVQWAGTDVITEGIKNQDNPVFDIKVKQSLKPPPLNTLKSGIKKKNEGS